MGGAAEYSWQPVSEVPKYSLLPLLVGTLKVTIIASLIAIPLAVLAALYTAEFAPAWARETIKPAIEILAGIPSVVVGFFCLMVLAGWLQSTFGWTFRLNAVTAGIGLEPGGDPDCLHRLRRCFFLRAADLSGWLDRHGRLVLADGLPRCSSGCNAGSPGRLRARIRQSYRRNDDCPDGFGQRRNPVSFSYGFHPDFFRHDCGGIGRSGRRQSSLPRARFSSGRFCS